MPWVIESPSATHSAPPAGPAARAAALACCQARAYGSIWACTARTPGSATAAAR